MALPLDSLTLTAPDAKLGDAGSSLGASMPGFAPLAMPAQSFRRILAPRPPHAGRATARPVANLDPSRRVRRRLGAHGLRRL